MLSCCFFFLFVCFPCRYWSCTCATKKPMKVLFPNLFYLFDCLFCFVLFFFESSFGCFFCDTFFLFLLFCFIFFFVIYYLSNFLMADL